MLALGGSIVADDHAHADRRIRRNQPVLKRGRKQRPNRRVIAAHSRRSNALPFIGGARAIPTPALESGYVIDVLPQQWRVDSMEARRAKERICDGGERVGIGLALFVAHAARRTTAVRLDPLRRVRLERLWRRCSRLP